MIMIIYSFVGSQVMPSSYATVTSAVQTLDWLCPLPQICHPQTEFRSSTFFSQHFQRVVEKPHRLGISTLGARSQVACHTHHQASLLPIEVYPCLFHSCSPAWYPHEHWTQILDSSLIILSYKGQFLNMFLMHAILMSLPLSCPFIPKGKKYPCINLISFLFSLFSWLFHSISFFACSIVLYL